jgi:hypothetical protein
MYERRFTKDSSPPSLPFPMYERRLTKGSEGGSRYILVPKAALEHEQQDKISMSSAEITRLKETRDKLERAYLAAENEFRELVEQSPALMQAIMR